MLLGKLAERCKRDKIPDQLTIEEWVIESAASIVQTCGRQVNEEVREGLSQASEKGGGRYLDDLK